MYGQNRLDDTKRALRAMLTNQIARWAPRTYVQLTAQTGRGAGQESPSEIADYFRRCFDDYFLILDVAPRQIGAFLNGKRILEYGPGDIPGVAVLMVAHGAESVICIDRFPLLALSPKNVGALRCLINGLEGLTRQRAESCFLRSGDPSSGFSPRIRYLIRRSGLSGLENEADMIISRAVLEHVDNLDATFADMQQALKEGGLAIHEVDLKSHGLHRKNTLDFLTWPEGLWSLMYSHKGVPNRWRIDGHRRAISASGLQTLSLQPTSRAELREIEEVRKHLAPRFRSISEEDLSWLGFWALLRKGEKSHQETTSRAAATINQASR